MNQTSLTKLDARSIELRKKIVKALASAGRGHLGPAFSIVEILRVLYDDVMKFNPDEPEWSGRDRFILSKGHGCVALYVALADKGFFAATHLSKLCAFDSMLGGHPESNIPGVEASTGSLGHGLPIGVGMAVHAKMKKLGHRVFVLLGDGECNEGSVWEGAMCAAKHKLDNLVAIIDYNKSQAYGPSSEVLAMEPLADKWRSFGFGVIEVDGHNVNELRSIFNDAPVEDGKPTAVICHTIKGKGAAFAENNMEWHHKNRIGENEIKELFEALENNDA